VLAKLLPSMFGFQTMVVCRPMPGVRQILTQSEKYQIADLRVGESLTSKQPEPEHAAVS
jgi:hypothetical protein